MSVCMVSRWSGPPGGGQTPVSIAVFRVFARAIEVRIGPDMQEARDRAGDRIHRGEDRRELLRAGAAFSQAAMVGGSPFGLSR